jgi:chitinase
MFMEPVTMGQPARRHIGRILLDGRFLSQQDLDHALNEQVRTKELLGQVLVRLGVLSADDVRLPLTVQQNLGNVDDAVKLAVGERQLLGALLVQSGHITDEQLNRVIAEQHRSGEKLGVIFKRLGLLTEDQLKALLDFQHNQEVPHSSPLRLGNLLVATGQITRQQLEDALRQQTVTHKKLGEVLVESGYVSPSRIKYGVRLQKMLLNAVLAAIISFGMRSGSEASTVGLQWDPNSEPGVSGYKVYYSADPSTLEGSTPVDVHQQTSATISGLDPGKSYRFAVKAYDSDGHESPFSNIVTTPELLPPTVAITSPENATSVSGTVLISASATDNVGVTKVEFYINGQLLATQTTAPYVHSWDTTSSAPGVYTLLVKAYDTAGNVSESCNTVINSVQDVNAPTLQAAYDIAVTGSGVVHLKAADAIPADTGSDSEFIAGTDRDVVIAGGYDASNQTRSGVTVVTGAMKIRAGKVVAEGIALRNPTTGQGS